MSRLKDGDCHIVDTRCWYALMSPSKVKARQKYKLSEDQVAYLPRVQKSFNLKWKYLVHVTTQLGAILNLYILRQTVIYFGRIAFQRKQQEQKKKSGKKKKKIWYFIFLSSPSFLLFIFYKNIFLPQCFFVIFLYIPEQVPKSKE